MISGTYLKQLPEEKEAYREFLPEGDEEDSYPIKILLKIPHNSHRLDLDLTPGVHLRLLALRRPTVYVVLKSRRLNRVLLAFDRFLKEKIVERASRIMGSQLRQSRMNSTKRGEDLADLS